MTIMKGNTRKAKPPHTRRAIAGGIAPLVVLVTSGKGRQKDEAAGALLALGKGNLTKTKFKSMIETGQGDSGNYVLPPEGLCLIGVKYNDSVSIPL